LLTLLYLVRRKRASARAPELPADLKSIWTPIIFRMDDAYEGFVDVLIGRMVELLSVNNDPGEFSLASKVIETHQFPIQNPEQGQRAWSTGATLSPSRLGSPTSSKLRMILR